MAGGVADVGAHLGARLGAGRQHAATTRSTIARLFKAAGADLIDVSSGQTTREAKPIYGRMYQTPFADRIRNEVGIATMAVGAIYEADHVNSIIMAGRADLCALARPHLADPYWTLHAAAQLGYADMPWPDQYLSGKSQLERNLARAALAGERQAGGERIMTEMPLMEMPLEGAHAVITGGGRGIGLAIAQRLSSLGATLTLIGRDRSRLFDAVQSLPATARCDVQVCDVTDFAARSDVPSTRSPARARARRSW